MQQKCSVLKGRFQCWSFFFQCLPSFWPVALFTPKAEKRTQPPRVFYRCCWEFPGLFLLLAPVLLQSDRGAGRLGEQLRP